MKTKKESTAEHSEKNNLSGKKGYNEENETQPTATDNKKKINK